MVAVRIRSQRLATRNKKRSSIEFHFIEHVVAQHGLMKNMITLYTIRPEFVGKHGECMIVMYVENQY